MIRYYCRPIKRYVCFIVRDDEVLLFAHKTGELLCCITIPFSSAKKNCFFIDNKTYPWLSDWLVEKGVANPTHRSFIRDGFSYEEFKFKKEI